MTLQEEMIRFRAKNNLSQTKACKMANITLQTWNQVELGNQKPSRMTESKIRQVIGKEENEQ